MLSAKDNCRAAGQTGELNICIAYLYLFQICFVIPGVASQ